MAPKKAPKKAPHEKPHKEKDHDAGKHLRRAYEHMGRLEALRPVLPKTTLAQVAALTESGRRGLSGSLDAREAKNSAELLRACEHLAFGALASDKKAIVSDELRDALTAQYEKLREKALDRRDEHQEDGLDAESMDAGIVAAYDRIFESAEVAHTKTALRKALELMRAAEALTHVHVGEALALEDGPSKPKRLK